jgi:hypothetical protein
LSFVTRSIQPTSAGVVSCAFVSESWLSSLYTTVALTFGSLPGIALTYNSFEEIKWFGTELNRDSDHVFLDAAAFPDIKVENPLEFKAACKTHYVLRIDGTPQRA